MFVTIVGIDGSGKSTLIQALSVRVSQETQRAVRLTGEPGGTRLGKSIRKLLLELTSQHEQMAHDGTLSEPINLFIESPIPLAELLLFSSARAQHCVRIRDWLNHGEIVMCDRFSDCTYAYQGALGLRDDIIEAVERAATGGLAPDVTFLLDIPVDTAFERLLASRGALDRREQSGKVYYNEVRERYLELADLYPQRITVLDATLPVDVLVDIAWNILKRKLRAMERGTKMAKRSQRGRVYQRITQALADIYARGEVPILRDVAATIPASPIYVSRVNADFLREHPEYDTPENRERATHTRVRRMQDARRDQGFPSLRKQAAAGYPNLVKGRKALAARRANAPKLILPTNHSN